jgi:HK97 gp10 family phage protein
MDSRRDEIEVGSGISDPPYPEFLEEGTRAMKARPFMKPVVDDLKKELPDKVMSAIINSARRV